MDILSALARLLLAALLGAVIDMEREAKNRVAGFRTHIIVSVRACLTMLIGIDAIGEVSSDQARDTARLAGQVVSGIGFLDAGTILQKKNGISGLTIAAVLWLSAATGLATGIGYYEGAIIVTIIYLITLISLQGVSDLTSRRTTKSYVMIFDTNNFNRDYSRELTSKEGVEIRRLNISDEDMDDKSMVQTKLSFYKNYNIGRFFKKLKTDFDLESVKLSKQEDWDQEI